MFDLIYYKTLFKKNTNDKIVKIYNIRNKRGGFMAREFAKKFYSSSAWKRCRESYIVSVHNLCERCERPGYIVHHKVHLNEMNINNPDVSLNHDNLEYLCLECHNEHHKFNRAPAQITRPGLKFNENGELVQG